ncbi:PAS domain S-box-containing protein [Arcicella aurantiaca]|uniref:PAS domain S-box-containing protein n=1 Tax=Arcicella aurantiaca TaxID=591202 RepID=A0A316DF29_9BACT|nr:PAS domain-containing protein [Arcicella aurantiaca]PWK16644.1 PAS domain S-box-containing protein [Arcicella aurantiaca]
MFCLSSNTHCDSFRDFHSATPLLAAYEFMEISRKDALEFELFESFAHDKQWAFDLNKVKRFLQDRKNSIVITCKNQKIEWVNKGFSRMTGYESGEALGQFPRFLQGKETSSEAKIKIRNKLNLQEKYSGKIINYRKNGEKYLCKVDILPVFDKQNSLVNFIAFEHEVEK